MSAPYLHVPCLNMVCGTSYTISPSSTSGNTPNPNANPNPKIPKSVPSPQLPRFCLLQLGFLVAWYNYPYTLIKAPRRILPHASLAPTAPTGVHSSFTLSCNVRHGLHNQRKRCRIQNAHTTQKDAYYLRLPLTCLFAEEDSHITSNN